MINTRRFLGELDADKDDQLNMHFVDSPFLQRIKNYDSDVIFGLKGVGKTALRRALSEIESSFFCACKTIDLSSISFESLLKSLVKLNDTTSVELPSLARSVWMNNLVHYGLETLAEFVKERSLKNEIIEVLQQEKFLNPNSKIYSDTANRKIIAQVERIFDYITKLGLIDDADTNFHSLNASQVDVFNIFPLNPEVVPLLSKCETLIRNQGKKIIICLDGFDTIIDHRPESRKAIFAGLIDAIFRLRADKVISKIFCFKAFLPKELTADAESIVWDLDKNTFNRHFLKWTKKDFEHLLEKRMFKYSRKRSVRFADIWPDFFPDKITNPVHNIDEPSFDYIARHTLYRPRQVLTHVQRILDRWDENYASFRVDPSFIPQIVAETNNEMAEQVASQLQIVFPNIKSFLKSWYKSNCVMTVTEFKERLQTYFSDLGIHDLNKIFNDLYTFGIFGILKNKMFDTQLGKKSFKFAFSESGPGTNIHMDAEENDYLAFCPMFREYCGLNSSEHGIIMTS